MSEPKLTPKTADQTIGIISLGCAKNLVDSETIAARAQAAGFRMAARPEKADVVLINTCAFIKDAQQESVDAILEACAWKAAGQCRAILVAGCLPQRFRNEIVKAMPEVDAFIGLDNATDIAPILRRLVKGERGISRITRHARKVIEPPPGRPLFTAAPYAYIKISEGCDNRCAYCAIPGIRGAYRSRPLDGIVREAESLLERGVRELNLISQDVTAYGCDLGRGVTLPRLLRRLDAIGGRFWMRLLYGHPAHVTPELLDTMGDLKRICKYLDLPIQHSHPEILAAMNRPLPAGGLAQLFNNIRQRLPGIALRTTCLTGFPGETERHFRHLLEFTADMRFDHLGVFKYSPEEGTPAADLPRRASSRIMAQRERRLMLQQRRIIKEKTRALIGSKDTILIERPASRRAGTYIGRSAGCAPEVDGIVRLVNAPATCRPGKFIGVRYTRARGYDMEATT